MKSCHARCGRYGEVHRACDTGPDRIVAVKILASHFSSAPELEQRMERKAKAISSLNPHICHLYNTARRMEPIKW